VTGTGPGGAERAPSAAPAVVALCHEYAALAGAAVAGLAEFLADAAELAVRLLPTAQSARIRVRVPEVVTAVADAAGPLPGGSGEVLAIPLVGGGDLAGVLELDSAGRGDFPTDERELAEVLAVLLTLSLGNAA
jgi:GAF domain-containing protein